MLLINKGKRAADEAAEPDDDTVRPTSNRRGLSISDGKFKPPEFARLVRICRDKAAATFGVGLAQTLADCRRARQLRKTKVCASLPSASSCPAKPSETQEHVVFAFSSVICPDDLHCP